MESAEAGPNQKVLVVDDSLEIREFLSSYLEFLKFDVVTAEDGRQGLERAQREKPDLVIADVVMPHMGGIDLCRALKGNPATALWPVILITANDDRDSRIQGLEAGADEFLLKPIDPHELQARVRSLTRQNTLQRELAAASKVPQVGKLLKEELTRALVHDLNNYLSGIQGNVNIMELFKAKFDEKMLRAMGAIKRSCRDMLQMLGDLREVVRLEAGSQIAVKEPCKLEDLAVQTVDILSRADHMRTKEIRAEAATGSAPILAEARLINRSLAILLEVALKCAEDSLARIAIRPVPEKGLVEAVIAFKGMVVPDELCAVIFLPEGPVKAREAGYVLDRGFSLLLVGLTARVHDGSIVLQNLGDGDSRFVFTLPLAQVVA
ncbi:MAG: hybrid sensor histidine kinase/response regulator [Planctomycetes bacterium]|nr:hybrid sensor histidine kinase/response regulator [Planctomycetota bacterium]